MICFVVKGKEDIDYMDFGGRIRDVINIDFDGIDALDFYPCTQWKGYEYLEDLEDLEDL